MKDGSPSVYKDKAGVVLNRPEITVSEKMNIAKEHLALLEPDFKVMENLSRELQVVGVHAFSLTNESELIAVCRNFAPLYGIDEESATGTANCALASYLYRHYEKREQYIFEQGHNLEQI